MGHRVVLERVKCFLLVFGLDLMIMCRSINSIKYSSVKYPLHQNY